MSKKICLFTAHSPLGGGGSVIIRSLIENLPEISFSWNYLADKQAPGYEIGYWGHGIMGGSFVTDVWQTMRMLTGNSSAKINEIIDRLLKVDCDSYWIISHNEGLRVALELSKRQKERPVHLTIHDDWAGALCARSFRYRLLSNVANKLTITTLRAVSDFDVISYGMQQYYLDISGKKGSVCHRYIPPDRIKSNGSVVKDATTLNVGHIGSIYDESDFFHFLSVLRDFVTKRNQKAVVQMWGSHLKHSDIPDDLRPMVNLHPGLPEDQVIPELARCAFVYSMYPMSERLRCFSRTSLPTKLTSYVLAGRPVFGHGPSDSTLAEFLKSTGTGVMWSCEDRITGMAAIEQILAMKPGFEDWQVAREKYFGEENLAVMSSYL